MMHKIFSVLLVIYILILPGGAAIVFAETQQQASQILQPVIQVDTNGEVDKSIIFDASKTTLFSISAKTNYNWDFGDGTEKDGVEVVHTYKKSGKYHLILEVKNGSQSSKVEKDIFIYRKLILLFTDKTEKKAQIKELTSYAENEGVFLQVLDSFDSASDFISEEALTKKISENIQTFTKADEIIVWTDGNVGLNALSRLVKENPSLKLDDLTQKIFLIVNDQVDKIRVSQQLKLLQSKQIFVAKEASIYPFIQSTLADTVVNFKKGGYEFKLIDQESERLQLWNFMSYFVNFLVDSGIPDNTIILILMLPVIAMVVVLMRQVIGMQTYGMYTPLIVTLTFFILGLKFALIILALFIVVGTLTRLVLHRTRLLYVPKLGLVVTMIGLSLFAFLIIGISFKLFDSQFFSLAIFPMLILGTLTEKFTSVQSKQSFISTLKLTLQTLVVSILAYVVIGGEVDLGFINFRWDFLQNLLRTYPEVIFLFVLINIALGKWTGLRLVEYIRFREILSHNEEE